MNQDEFNLRVQERVAKAEERVDSLDSRVQQHDSDLRALAKQMTKLVDEVRQIRNALYLLAAMVSANIPAVESLVHVLKVSLIGK